MNKVKITCPCCGKRVMDKVEGATGVVEIKCPHCKQVVSIRLDRKKDGTIHYRIVA
mgnify:FL=1